MTARGPATARPSAPTVLDILQARRRLSSWLAPMPLRPSRWLTTTASAPVYLKLESLNDTHSFKIRGALNALLCHRERHPDAAARPVVVTASAGNHGRAMASAAERLGLRVVVFTPATAPRTKRDAIRSHGATLHDAFGDYDQAERAARAFADTEGAAFISPYNHPDVIAGAGTVGLEIVEALPSVASVFVPLGGGGLASGVGLALAAAAPDAALVGVEAEASTPFTASLSAGAITAIDPKPTLADGLAGNLEPGTITFPLVARLAREVVTVSEPDLRQAIVGMASEEHLIVEGAAAAAVAAAARHAGRVGGPVVAIVTGANIDPDVLRDVLGP